MDNLKTVTVDTPLFKDFGINQFEYHIKQNKIIFPYKENYYLQYNENEGKYEYSWLKKDNEIFKSISTTIEKSKPITSQDDSRNKNLYKFLSFTYNATNQYEIDKYTNNIAILFKNGTINISDIINPILKLDYKRSDKKLQAESGKYLQKKYYIKRVNKEYFYYNKDDDTNDKLTINHLGALILKEYDINFDDKTLKDILSTIQREDKKQKHIWEFKNLYFNTINYEPLKNINQNKSSHYNKSKIITDHKFGIINENTEKLQLLTYDTNAKINGNTEKTLVQKTIEQILIPKDNPKDNKLLIDYLQRLGASLYNYNKHKTITIYKGDTNQGKSILNLLLSYIFNNRYAGITPQTFKENFNQEVLSEKNILAIDELDNNSFKDITSDIKRISSGSSPVHQRKIYSDEIKSTSDYGNLFLFTNQIPKINFNEKALISRIDIIQLPNKFVDKESSEEQNKNYYIIDSTLKNKLKEDIEGLSWLISVSIKEYEKLSNNNKKFECHQNTIETLNTIENMDTLTTFILSHITEDSTSSTTNIDIKTKYGDFCENNDIEITQNYNRLSANIGTVIKRNFNNYQKVKNPNVGYEGLKLLDIEDE